MQLRKSQEQLEDYAVENWRKDAKKEKQMKEKEEQEKLFIDEHFCVNAWHSCYDNLIREEREKTEKGKNLEIEKNKRKKEKQEE